MNKSETIGQLAAALAAAQGEMKPAKENAVNPFFKSRYADLGSIIDALRDPFSKNGLSYTQIATSRAGNVAIETVLMHASGEWMSDVLELPLVDEKGLSSVQALGKMITYMRRYALASIAGVYSDEDTDGNAPTVKPQAQPQAQSQPQVAGNSNGKRIDPATMYWNFAKQHNIPQAQASELLKQFAKDGFTDWTKAQSEIEKFAAEAQPA